MTMLERGQVAPDFSAQTFEGEEVTLSAYRGAKLWLTFYRFASCPLCNYRIHEVLARYDEFTNAGIRLVGVFQSPPEKIAKYVAKKDPPFSLISDPELELYRLYGVSPNVWAMFKPEVFATAFKAMLKGIFPGSIDGPVAMRPAEFLIDPEGLIWDAFYGRSVSDHMPFEKVVEFAADPCLSVPA